MTKNAIQNMIREVFASSESREIEEGYLLLSTGRVFEVTREGWPFSYDSYEDRLGIVEKCEDSDFEDVESRVKEINDNGGAAILLHYSDYSGEMQPYPWINALGAPAIIYATKEMLAKERISRMAALRTLAAEIQDWNTWNRGNYYVCSIYQSAEAYLKHESENSAGYMAFYPGYSLATYAYEMLEDLTPEEVEEIRAKFDSSL